MGRRTTLLTTVLVLVLAVALWLVGPASAQETQADPAPLTMEEAERVIYGLRDALYANDLETAMSFFAADVHYLSHTESSAGMPSDSKYAIEKAYFDSLVHGCRPMSAISGIEGNTVQYAEYWSCAPRQFDVHGTLVQVEAAIEDGLIVAYDELIFDTNRERWKLVDQLHRDYERFAAALRRGDLTALEEMLADDVELSLSYDPVTGGQIEATGKDAVLALAASWKDAGVKYGGVGWTEQGMTTLANGRLKWPEWTELMGVDLRTEDKVTFRDGTITLISIGGGAEMMRVLIQRQEAAKP